MSIPELLNFRKEAIACHVKFFCEIMLGGVYLVEADAEFLDYLGF